MSEESDKWDRRFLALAEFVSSWSKDPSTKVGAVIVDPKQRIVSLGFNGLPRGMSDNFDILGDRELKLQSTIHAEENALLFASRSVDGCTLYVHPLPPCGPCAAKIAQMGIVRVVAPDTRAAHPRWEKSFAAMERIFSAGVRLDLLL